MPSAPPRACERCGKPTTEGWLCEACKPKTKEPDAPKREEKFYNSALWRTYTSPNMRRYNPICQKLENEKQCTRPSTVVHHIQDPTSAPELKTDWANLVAVCAEHHAGGQPGDKDIVQYVHTYGPLGAVYRHTRHADWYSGNDKDDRATLPAQPQGRTTAVGTKAQERALADLGDLLDVQLPR